MKTSAVLLKVVAIIWLLTVVITVVLAVQSKPTFDSSIMSLLPESEQKPIVKQAIEQMSDRFSKRLILLLSGDNEEEVRSEVHLLAGKLAALPAIEKIDWHVDSQQFEQAQKALYPYRFSLLDDNSRNLLSLGHYQQLQDSALSYLYNPVSVGKVSLLDDPFSLYSQYNLSRKSDINIKVSNSLLKVTKASLPTYMIMLTLADNPFSPNVQQTVLGEITAQKASLKQAGIALRMSGMLLHAEAGASQAKHEISTIGLGSLIGIIIVMFWVFRQWQPLILMMFPVVVGCMTAASVCVLVFGQVHLITFAFGAGLVGVSIDYALHFICERQVASSEKVIRKIVLGLLLGLFSSVAAYAVQAFTPFPGLQQMAVFSVVGLCASWLTVVLCFPLMVQKESKYAFSAMAKLDALRAVFPRIEGRPVLIILIVIMTIISIQTILNSPNHDDIRLLQTSPPELIQQDQNVQKLLGGSSSSQFLLINESSLEACLQKEEQIVSVLENLTTKGQLLGYQALSQQLPSLKKQAENRELVNQLYQHQLDSFYTKLGLSDDKLTAARLALKQAEGHYLAPDVWLQQRESEAWQDLIVTSGDGSSHSTIIRFKGSVSDEAKQALVTLSNNDSGITYVDQVQNISDVISTYRTEVTYWILIAYLGVFLVLLLRYKTQVWRVVLPPLVASLFTLALLVQLESGLTLFHLMALLLVLGIGLDMGIFLTEAESSSHTWLAVSLSTYTSLLAFGLLALSNTPVLHQYGLTVLIGLVCVWLLTLIMRKKTNGEMSI